MTVIFNILVTKDNLESVWCNLSYLLQPSQGLSQELLLPRTETASVTSAHSAHTSQGM